MQDLALIGAMAVGVVRNALDSGQGEPGLVRFVMTGLSRDEIAAIAIAFQNDPSIRDRLEIALPKYGFADYPGIDEASLTEQTATELRHAECSREGRVIALLDDSQGQSLAQVDRLDASALLNKDNAAEWVSAVLGELTVPEEYQIEMSAALEALVQIDRVSMRQVANYLVNAADEIRGGEKLTVALGRSLLKLRLPRADDLFEDIKLEHRRRPSEWSKRYQKHWRRECFVAKRDLNQIPLSNAKLRERLKSEAARLSEAAIAVLGQYIEAQLEDREAIFAPFELDWPEIAPLFEEAQRDSGKSIGAETKAYYELYEDLVTAEETAYLNDLATARGRSPEKNEYDEAFFNRHAVELRNDARLYALWDKFIYGREESCTDLLEGLVKCLKRLRPKNQASKGVLVVEGMQYRKGDFLPLNHEACAFFATRYRGLEEAFPGLVQFQRLLAFDYLNFAEEIADRAKRQAQATSKRARQLEFRVAIHADDGEKTGWIKLVWQAELDAVGIGLRSDLGNLLNNKTKSPLVLAKAGQRRARTRGGPGGVNLENLSTLEPASQRQRGSFIPSSSQCRSLAKDFRTAVDKMRKNDLLDQSASDKILAAFGTFENEYREAISDLAADGASAASLGQQAHRYAAVLETILAETKRPVVLDELLKPLQQIGVAQIDGSDPSRPVVIVCPWHPLRLEAQHGRINRLKSIFSTLLSKEQVSFTDNSGKLYFEDLLESMKDSGRPELLYTWSREQAIVVTQVDQKNDYSLHERPVATGSRDASTNDSARSVARQVADLAQSYLKLQPHEKDNLSIVLFNCDAAALPQAVVDGIRADAEKDGGDAMCQVVLRHTDERQLRALYQQIVMRELEVDTLHASEATRDFMSRLRISILVDQQAPSGHRDGAPFDIVFCHDVISRNADQSWVDVAKVTRAADEIQTGRWSRRKPIGKGERDAVVYLTCPAQTEAGWRHLDAVAALSNAEDASNSRLRGQCRIPVRNTDVKSPITHRILQETHELGNWVVNFDDLLDRRQLLNNEIKIIRYKHAADGERSLIVSSKAPDNFLRATLKNRLKLLRLGYEDTRLDAITTTLIDDANDVSGDIVLRAARRGANASELMGVVLSKYLVQHELGGGRPLVWIFLDDYASWLGQDEQRMADLLCLAPYLDENGSPCLDIVVTEAKYVRGYTVSGKAEDSKKQLADTLKRFELVFASDAPPADKDIWLARLSEMLLDGLRDQAANDMDWRRLLRDGACKISVRGYSHVFASTQDDEPAVLDSVTGVPGTDGIQERFGFESVGAIVRAYAEKQDPSSIRQIPPRHPDKAKVVPQTSGADDVAPPQPEEPAAAATHPGAAEVQFVSSGSKFKDLLASWNETSTSVETDQAWLEEISASCRTALLRYGLSARLESSILTPNAALLKFRGADDLTVAKVEAKATELETTHGIQLFDVRAEPGRVVLSIKRPQRRMLTLPEVWTQWDMGGAHPNSRLLIAVKEDDGMPLFLEPDPAPHSLVAGSTGSGKSVLLQNIILGIGATNKPTEAKIVLIDPKSGVDYFAFDRLPHLDGAIIDQQEEALQKLDELVLEMERRYALFKTARVSNVRAYNATAFEPIPLIWLIHDEFADWMQIDSYKLAVDAAVSRLGVKARAAGIYLIFAAQRPDNSVFPMQLRSNLGNRLILRVDSAGTSDLSLGVKGGGAERLLGKGHLAAILGGGTEPVFAQVPYISEERLEALVDALVEDLAKADA
ncbi:FtsK/SpoIIIE domain-containing protein [Rhizobium leguminosarum]|uniref:FtsK/SpoIIIE domain-containing protein n=1 Tax=Rhizobium leguminosarum TaxID=384 RepID=UPI003F9E6CA3